VKVRRQRSAGEERSSSGFRPQEISHDLDQSDQEFPTVVHCHGRGRAFGYEPNARPISSYFFLENIGFSQISYRLFAQGAASAYYVLKAAKKLSPQIAE